jgi:hypothetical protein
LAADSFTLPIHPQDGNFSIINFDLRNDIGGRINHPLKTPATGVLIGDDVVITSRGHIPPDTLPGRYNSNQPVGGFYCDTEFMENFYQEADLDTLS